MIAVKNSNSRAWRTLQTVALIATLGFVFVDKLVMPNVNSGRLAETVQLQAQEIAGLKEVVNSLRPLPAEVYGLKASVDGMVKSINRFEQTLISHIERR